MPSTGGGFRPAALLLRHRDGGAVGELLPGIEHHAIAGLEAAHLDEVADLAAARHLDPAGALALDAERDGLALALHERTWLHGHDGFFLIGWNGLTEKRDLRAHVGQHPRI